MTTTYFIVCSVFAPMVLLVVETLFPYPYVFEELTKYILVSLLLKTGRGNTIYYIVLFGGVLFAFSESMLYLTNIFVKGMYVFFPMRIVFTSILHSGSMVMMCFGIKKGKYSGVLVLIISVILHYLYNFWVVKFY